MLRKLIKNPFFVFPVITSIIFWPLTFQFFALKNDALTYYYPVRTLISDALNNGELPLWTPFINMGYPLHADMQSGAWNPLIWIFSFLTHYSLAAFHYELLCYIAFAGIGFYFLCKDLGCSKYGAFTMAVAYQCSGFVIDSVQFFNCISSACYLPFIFLFFRKMLVHHKISDALLLGFFLFLMFTGGYPSIFIISFYVLLAYAIFIFINSNKKKLFVRKSFPVCIVAVGTFLLLSLPAIISFIDLLPWIERGKSQSLQVVLENSMNPATTLSVLAPFATTANDGWLSSSILMRNLYIGIIPLLFVFYGILNRAIKINKETVFFLITALITLAMAWGNFFFLRQLAYYVLPLMNSFRHPALFRLFTVFFLLLASAQFYRYWEIQKDILLLKRILLFFLYLILTIALTSLFFINCRELLYNSDRSRIFASLNFSSRFLIQLPFLFLGISLAYYAIVKKKNILLVCLFIVADLFFSTQLNMPVTVFGAKSFKEVKNLINRNPVSFPVPGNKTIEENSADSYNKNIITGSTLPFIKKIGRNDFFITPSNLLLQDSFYESSIKNTVFKNPVLYWADTEKTMAEADEAASILIRSFSANKIEIVTNKKTAGLLVYLQNKYSGWKADIDKKQTSILPVNISFMAIQVPAGQHNVTFYYRPLKIITAWYISIFTLAFIILILFSRLRKEKHRKETEPF